MEAVRGGEGRGGGRSCCCMRGRMAAKMSVAANEMRSHSIIVWQTMREQRRQMFELPVVLVQTTILA